MYFTSVHDCIKGRGLRKCPVDPEMVRRELAEAGNDLESAKQSFQKLNYKWAIIQGYYSMFHSFKSLLCSIGYNEKNHECVIIGVEELFTGKGKLPSNLVTKIKNAKYARETADYGCTYDKVAAQGIIADAEEVYRIIENFLTKE